MKVAKSWTAHLDEKDSNDDLGKKLYNANGSYT